MKIDSNVQAVYNSNLCTLCGICKSVCPVGAISISIRAKQKRLYVDQAKCLSSRGCRSCLDVCGGYEINLGRINSKFQEAKQYERYIGNFYSTFYGWSKDPSIRIHSPSGGLTTSLLSYLLDKKYINGAFVSILELRENKVYTKTILARTQDEILSGRGSKYCPVTMESLYSELKRHDGVVAVVGLPCHLHSVRKMLAVFPQLQERIFGLFSLYCSSTRDFQATDFLIEKYANSKGEIKRFSYRDEGCLGNMIIEKDGMTVKIPYEKYYR